VRIFRDGSVKYGHPDGLTDAELVATIREFLSRTWPDELVDASDVANILVAELERHGAIKAVDDLCSLVRLEAAAAGVRVSKNHRVVERESGSRLRPAGKV
jgi:hypothetical protein